MDIYYKYSHKDELFPPTKGDYINELNMIHALSQFHNVYYNGFLYSDGVLDKTKTKDKYDLAFIRANKHDFFKIKATKKLWVAAPYDLDCYTKADAVITYSEEWRNHLLQGIGLSSLNPNGLKFTNAIYLQQVMGTKFNPQTGAKVLKDSYKTPFLIGYFGRIIKNNYPTLLVMSWNRILKTIPGTKMVIGKTFSDYKDIKLKNIVTTTIKYKEMPNLYHNCDVVIESYSGSSWDYCGSIKEKECCVMGTPIILEKSPARIETFGENYPLFMPRRSMSKPDKMYQRMLLEKLMMLQDKTFVSEVKAHLIKQGEKFRFKNAANNVNKIISSI